MNHIKIWRKSYVAIPCMMLIMAILMAGCATQPSSGGMASQPALSEQVSAQRTIINGDAYPVWYATNRAAGVGLSDLTKIQSCTDDFKLGHGIQLRGQKTIYGKCMVEIPAVRQLGSTSGLEIDPIDFKAYGESFADFWIDVNNNRLTNSDKSVLVFIHGFNVPFRDAIIRGAQLGHDLSAPTTIVFSWPTSDREKTPLLGIVGGYPADEANIEASEDAIGEFLMEMIKKASDEHFSLHVIAHSMGNRGVLRGLERAYLKAGGKLQGHIDQIVLASPDVDDDVFKHLGWVYSKVANRTTIYTSKGDHAVQLSAKLHEAPRVGFAPPEIVTKFADTVETTNAKAHWLLSEWADRMDGHDDFSDKYSVLHDLKLVLNGKTTTERQLFKCQQGYYAIITSDCTN